MSAEEITDQKPLSVGDFAPDFTLDTDSDGSVTLSELRGRNVVVYFYPRDNTPGCTIEAREFSDAMDDFEYADTVIIGISKDSPQSHDKFKDKCDLSITLASDERGSVCEAYGVWVEKNMYGKKSMGIRRATFLIDSKGAIRKIWPKVKVEGHVEEVLDAAREL